MLNRRAIGQNYEQHACRILSAKGLKLIAQNSVSRLGEIDLVMQDGECLVFVEVRYRKNALYGDAESTVTYKKQQKIKQAAYEWMLKNTIDCESQEYRFDVVAFTGLDFRWLQNAFYFSGDN